MARHYVRFVRALALLGVSVAAPACRQTPSSPAPLTTGGSCRLQGQPCTVGEPTPANAVCCQCTARGEQGAVGDAARPGTWGNVCIGPLPPPALAA